MVFFLVQKCSIEHAFRHPFHWSAGPESSHARTWKRTHWMTLESPCAYRYHEDSWHEPAMKVQICVLYPRQCRGQRRASPKRAVSLPSTVPRIEECLKNDQKCLKIQKVAGPCGSQVRDLGFHVSEHVKSQIHKIETIFEEGRHRLLIGKWKEDPPQHKTGISRISIPWLRFRTSKRYKKWYNLDQPIKSRTKNR